MYYSIVNPDVFSNSVTKAIPVLKAAALSGSAPNVYYLSLHFCL